jgi:hypothetical protein
MTQWAYRVVDSEEAQGSGFLKVATREDVEKYFNNLGRDGLEVVNLTFREWGSRCQFTGVAKRPLSLS